MDRRHAGAGRDDAGQVQRVDGGDAHELALLLLAADGAERLHGLRPRVLLAVEAGDEAAAADDALRLHAAEHLQHLAPGNAHPLLARQVAEDDAVAEEQLLRPGLGQLLGRQAVASQLPLRQERPAAGRHTADGERPEEASPLRTAEAALLVRGHERAQRLEAVGRGEAARDELPEAALDVRRQTARGGGDVVIEERAL